MESTALPPELTQDETLDEFEEVVIEDEQVKKHRANGSNKVGMLFKGAFVLANITLMGFVAFTVFKPDDGRYKALEEQVSVNKTHINNVAGTVKTNTELQQQFENSIANLRTYIDENSANSSGKITLSSERVDAIELRLQAIEKNFIAAQKVAKAKQSSTKASAKNTAKKRAVISPMSLVSIRSQGDYGMVNLATTQGDQSPLLRNGDEWKGWKFLRLEGRRAVFEVSGRERQLTL